MKPLLFVLLSSFISISVPAQEREAQWKRVSEALENDQPKTASNLLLAIEAQATEEKAWGEAGKAILLNLSQEKNFQRDPLFAFRKIEERLPNAAPELRPLFRVLSAGYLFRYYQRHSWQFIGRTDMIGSEKDNDPTIWSFPRFHQEIDRRFQLALKEAKPLQNTPVSLLDGLLEQGSLPDKIRPSLYDFVAYEAIAYYSLEEVDDSQPAHSFQFSPDSPALGTTPEFLAWSPETGSSPKGQALRIFQNLIRFHQSTNNEAALLHCELERLSWASQACNRNQKSNRYQEALIKFATSHSQKPASARARVLLARLLLSQDRTVEAYAFASVAQKDYPEHPYGKAAQGIINEMEAPSLRVATESHWANPDEPIKIDHTNIDRVWFRLYSVPFPNEKQENTRALGPFLKNNDPVLTWNAKLSDPGDYRTRHTVVSPPVGQKLPFGFHYLVASSSEEFSWDDQTIAYQPIHITKLALTIRAAPLGGIDGYVVDAISGEPLANIDVKVSGTRSQKNSDSVNKKTDQNGYFHCPDINQHSMVVAKRGLERAVGKTWVTDRRPRHNAFERIVFFTDRSLYRPGQTVHFKAICCQANQGTAEYKAIADRKVSVSLYDPNGKTLGELDLKSNERGSLAGSFVVPRGRALGVYRISSPDLRGSSHISVEEYKRPKFFAELSAVKNEAALNQEIELEARAESYTGAQVDGAKVSWKVTREVRWPSWVGFCSWLPIPFADSEEIAYGDGETDSQGTFKISFIAKPDLQVNEELEPIFDYRVSVNITDGTGETRSSSRTVSLAYTALQAELETLDWLTTETPVAITVKTESHDGEPRGAEGTLKIHLLPEPEFCSRPENFSLAKPRYKFSSLQGGGFAGFLPPLSSPNEASNASELLRQRELGEVVAKFPIKTSAEAPLSGALSVEADLPVGCYRLVFETQDANGKAVKAYRNFEVHDSALARFPIKVPFYTATPDGTIEPGSSFQLLWGSGYKQARAIIEVYQDHQLLTREWTPENATQHLFTFPSHRKATRRLLWSSCIRSIKTVSKPSITRWMCLGPKKSSPLLGSTWSPNSNPVPKKLGPPSSKAPTAKPLLPKWLPPSMMPLSTHFDPTPFLAYKGSFVLKGVSRLGRYSAPPTGYLFN